MMFSMRLVPVLVSALAACSCSNSSSTDQSHVATVAKTCPRSDLSTDAGLVFASTTAKFDASSLHYCDFASGEVKTLLTGESGDPLPLWLGDKLHFFNRAMTSLNHRRLDPRAADGQPTEQRRTPEAMWGDPSAAVWLGDERAMLAMPGAKKLVVIQGDEETPAQVIDPVAAGLDVGPQSEPEKWGFYPLDLHRLEKDGVTRVLALHAHYSANGKSQVFVLEQKDGAWQFVDQSDQEGVQGIALHYTSPSVFLPTASSGQLLLVSLCTELSPAECRAGIERLDVKALKSEDLGSLAELDRLGTAVAPGPDGASFYAYLYRGDGSEKEVALITPGESVQKETLFSDFREGDMGVASIAYDRGAERLILGITTKTGNGRIVVREQGGAAEAYAAGGNPYKFVLVPKAP